MADPKVLEVIRKLRQRTAAGKVAWQQTVDGGVFQAAFSGYAVRLFPAPSRAGETVKDYVFQIFNEEGVLMEEVRDVDYDDTERGDTSTFLVMDGLYTDARRIAMGVDKAVRSLLADLADE